MNAMTTRLIKIKAKKTRLVTGSHDLKKEQRQGKIADVNRLCDKLLANKLKEEKNMNGKYFGKLLVLCSIRQQARKAKEKQVTPDLMPLNL